MGKVIPVWLAIAAFYAVFLPTIVGREVAVDVSAPWRKYSLDYVVEISQYLSSISGDSFGQQHGSSNSRYWEFQHALCSKNSSIDQVIIGEESSIQLKEDIMQSAMSLLPKNYQDLAELFLDLQNYVASVSFYNSLADPFSAPCGSGKAFVVLSDKSVACDFSATTDTQRLQTFEEWEHVYPLGSTSSKNHVVLYGIPGSSSFCSLLKDAISAIEVNKLQTFAVRPALSLMKPESNATVLQGYGVFLDIKNMEYKNVDDGASKSSTSDSSTKEEFSEEEIAGINFKKLFEYNQNSKKELLMLQDRLLQMEMSASDNLKEEMKVWQMKDLGLQVVQAVSTIATKGSTQDALQYLTEIIHNFPRFASRISATKVTHQVHADTEKFAMSGAGNWLPPNALYINGLRVDLSEPSFNVFDVLQKIQHEVSRESQLSLLNLGRIYSRRVYEAAYTSLDPLSEAEESASFSEDAANDVIRVDVSKGGKLAVSFLNNLEKDEMYMQWPKTLKTLLYPSWSLHALSRNIYTLVIVADVLSPSGAMLLLHARSIYMQQYPLRFGFVLDCEDSVVANDDLSAKVAKSDVCRVFSYLKEKKGMQRAASFLFSVAELVTESESQAAELTLTRQQLLHIAASDKGLLGGQSEGSLSSLISSFTSSASKTMVKDLDTMLNHLTAQWNFVSNSTAYLKARNLPMNSYSLNGIVVNEASLSSQTFMQILGREQFLLSNWVKAKRLQDKTKNSIFADIMSITKAYSRFHALLDDKATADYINPLDKAVLQVMQQSLVLSRSSVSDQQAAADELLVIAQATPSGIRNVIESLNWLQNPIMDGDEGEASPTTTSAETRRVNTRLVWRKPLSSDFETIAGEVTTSATGEIDGLSISRQSNLSERSLFDRVLQLVVANPCTDKCVSDFRSSLEGILKNIAHEEGSSVERNAAALSLASLGDEVAESGVKGKNLFDIDTLVFFNGRLLPVSVTADNGVTDTTVVASDLQLLRTIESKKVSKLTRQLVADLDLAMEHNVVPNATFLRRSMLRFLLSAYKQALDTSSRRFDISGVLQRHIFARGLEIPSLLHTITPPVTSSGGDDDYLFDAHFDNLQLYVMVDPLSLAGQRAVSIIELLTTRLRASVTLLLTPRTEINEFPLQNFYRFVLRQGSDVVSGADMNHAQSARFTALPRQHVLTVRLDTPERWNVQATRAEQDPDNLRCTAQSCGDKEQEGKKEFSSLGYTLKSLLVAGQCVQSTENDVRNGRFGLPPNGLQLVLTSNLLKKEAVEAQSPEVLWDTLVMQNLGYFQLQAKTPGWYRVQLAQGKATSLYRIYDANESDNDLEDRGVGLSTPVMDFGDKTHHLIVVKRRGLESYSLLDTIDGKVQKGGLWDTLSNGLFGKNADNNKSIVTTSTHEDDDKLHVFSLASGHMYERLLRIMMLSVSRQASRRVKFWLLENYLSPSFKEMAEVMSKRFGFDVAYVTYKWPHWLRHQTQQQRIIWGYKILFLDVLFPLHLKKVIYVDADQVVRADIAELWDMDLQGHAYAYTPFCSSREETLGFQFWRQGYWKDHLQGRPYHISALYVVDLQRFRQQTVGDQLRAVYDQLSRDPNSLANLDQDLPNYAQHAVPIFSLPQEWLWCETWCSEDSKSKAKTIDLCNNPLHKEPKLDMARRVISGKLFNQSWIQLDSEIRELAQAEGLLQD